MKTVVSLLAALLLSACISNSSVSQTACFHRHAEIEAEIGYCQAVRSGDTLHVSGVTAGGDMQVAVHSVYEQLALILEARGLSASDVVKETVFATDLDAFIQHKAIRKAFFGTSLPASSWVQVQRLYQSTDVVEVELTAQYPR